LDLAKHPDRFLSTVQIGITLVGILASAFGGGAVTMWLAGQLQRVPIIGMYSQSIALGVVVSISTPEHHYVLPRNAPSHASFEIR
jgi:putative hemolysin